MIKEYKGLTSKEAAESRRLYGSNVLSKKKKEGFIKKFIKNLKDPIIKILLTALLINIVFLYKSRNFAECIGIFFSVMLATFISTLSESTSEKAFEHLNGNAEKNTCKVYRDGHITLLDFSDVVVGDFVLLSQGEGIAADGELVCGELFVDNQSMTGESREFFKRSRKKGDIANISPSSEYYLHKGSNVLSGEGVMKVTCVGDETFLGKISSEVQNDMRESPLKLRLSHLARQISKLGYVFSLLIGFIYLFNIFVVDSHFDMDILLYKVRDLEFLFSKLFSALTLVLTVIVVAVPEGLPMMIAVVLSSNTKRMIKDNVLVKKPVGIESAGSMNILFCDKTGTLTEGKMSVSSLFTSCGYVNCVRELKNMGEIYSSYLRGAMINTQSHIGYKNKEKCVLGGNASEIAMLEFVRNIKEIKAENVKNIPFDSKTKMSYTMCNIEGKEYFLIKGAPEVLFSHIKSHMETSGVKLGFDKQSVLDAYKNASENGKRVLCVCEGTGNVDINYVRSGNIPNLCFVCLVIIEDKIRRSAALSVEKLRRAGIKTVMITGDGRITAESIAKECKIKNDEQDVILSSSEMARMSDIELSKILPRLCVVCRALPSDKSRLVRISGEKNMVVGMTGDGINDAPALRAADVGFSMGSGTQVAKDAGDVVILDDDLSSIVKAVHYGRNIFKSIRKFITLQLLINFCAVGVSVIGPFIGVDSPVTVVQMLWLNIIMDTLGGLAFAGEAPLESDMLEMPKKRDEKILNKYMLNEILVQGIFTLSLCILFLKLPYVSRMFRYSSDRIYLLSAFFAFFIFSSVFNCFGARTDRLKLFSGIHKNYGFVFIMSLVLIIQIFFVYFGGQVLRTVPLTKNELLFTFLFALLVIPAELVRKILWRLFFGKKGY